MLLVQARGGSELDALRLGALQRSDEAGPATAQQQTATPPH